MKKIVALVLGLALALSLCTVAFADEAMYDLFDKNGNQLATKTNLVYTKADEDVPSIAFYTINGVDAVKSDAANCDYIVKPAGKKTVHLYLKGITTPIYDDGYTKLAAYTKLGDSCGQFDYKDAGFKSGDKFYTVVDDNDDVQLLVKLPQKGAGAFGATIVLPLGNGTQQFGVIGELDDVVVDHTWDLDIESKTAKCTSCKATAKAVEKFAEVPSGADYEMVGGWYVLTSSATGGTAAAEAGTAAGVTSAKTFDAGIAMYAGLALMSVAGSAVVIGKKKD